jgi:hypothetical protein
MHAAAISFFGMLGTLWSGKNGLITVKRPELSLIQPEEYEEQKLLQRLHDSQV